MLRTAAIALLFIATTCTAQTVAWTCPTDTCVTVSGETGDVLFPCGAPWLAGCLESSNDTSTFIGTSVTFQEANQCYDEGIVTGPWGPLPGAPCVMFHFAALPDIFLNGVVVKYRSSGPERIRVDLDGQFVADLVITADSLPHDTAFVIGQCVSGSALMFRPYNGTGAFVFRELWLLGLPCLPTSVPEPSNPPLLHNLWYDPAGRQIAPIR